MTWKRKLLLSFPNLNNYNFMGICLFYYERLPAPDSREAILTYITKSFFVLFLFSLLLCSRRSFPPASSLVYVEISKIRKYLLGKKKKDQKIYLLLSPRRLLLHVFIGSASVGNREKKNVRNLRAGIVTNFLQRERCRLAQFQG